MHLCATRTEELNWSVMMSFPDFRPVRTAKKIARGRAD